MGLTPAPWNAWVFAWLALAPLWFWVTQAKHPLRSQVLHALLWGVAYHGFTISWLMGLHPLTWMGIPWLTSLAIALSCWILVTIWGTLFVVLWAIAMWSYQRFLAPAHPSAWINIGLRVWIGSAFWCGLEALRNLSPLDWNSLGFTQSPGNLAILHLGQLSGPLTITAAIAIVNGCWAESLSLYFRSGRQTNWGRVGAGITLSLFLAFHGLGFLLEQGAWAEGSQDAPVKIGVIQGNIRTREKLTDSGIQKARENYIHGYQELANQKVDLILTPEAAFPIRWQPKHPLVQEILATIRDRQVPIVLGTFMPTQGETTQSLISLTSQGLLLSRYDKVKLVILGEYIPNWLSGLVQRLSPMTGSLTPGDSHQVFQTPVGQAGVGICYDSVFSEILRSQVAAGGTFLMTASNLDPYSSVLMAQVHAHEVMRAVESDRDLVRATNTGFSGFVHAHGKTEWLSNSNVFTIQVVTIQPRHTQTLYVRWGNWLTPLLGVSSIVFLAMKGLIRKMWES